MLQSFLTYVGIGRRNDFLEPCFDSRLATSTCNVVFYSNLFTVLSCGGDDRQTLFPGFGQSRTLCVSPLCAGLIQGSGPWLINNSGLQE